MNKTSEKKHINKKILYKYVQKNHRIHPVNECWYRATSILFAGYKNEMEQREIEIKNGRNYKYLYLRKSDWVPKGHVWDVTKKFVLQKHIAYAAKLGQTEILDAFSWYLINLKEDQWAHSKIKKKKKSLFKRVEELLDNPKRLLKGRKMLYKQRLLKKIKYK